MNGQAGLINMPDARMAPDGTFRIGYSNADPYYALWTSLVFLPRLEFAGSFTGINGVPGFPNSPGTDYGDFKDKNVSGKFLLLPEGKYLPAFAIGGRDFTGTQVFTAYFAAASKRIGDFDLTVGYGSERLDGVFGGLRYSPSRLPSWSLVAEYDATDFSRDVGAAITGVNQREKGMNVGVEYRWGWLGAQLNYQHDEVGVNAYVSIPLQQREFIPKIAEPPPYTKVTPRPTAEQWAEDPAHRQRMLDELLRQDFREIRIGWSAYNLDLVLTNSRISEVSRAVGRAARIALLLSPVETREIRITYTDRGYPLGTYTFFELKKLERYFNGMIPRAEFAEYVEIQVPGPRAFDQQKERTELLTALTDPGVLGIIVESLKYGDYTTRVREDSLKNRFKLGPFFEAYVNDPSGFFRYAFGVYAGYTRRLMDTLYLDGYVTANISENISDVTQRSNSLLPHVRSDIAEYKEGADVKVQALYVTKYFRPTTRTYARLSGGLLEEMFGGLEAQWLYLPRHERWAADLTVDWVKQRDFDGIGFRDYSTVTALAAYHQKLPFDLTGTVRAGRFLAKDEGARFELKRRFRSGFEVGAWYTWTNGNDITSPGSPGSPYHDKGVWMSIPLETMLPSDTQSTAVFAFAPWTRDVGQMVYGGRDLYHLLEDPRRETTAGDGLTRFGDREDDYKPPWQAAAMMDLPLLDIAKADAASSAELPGDRRFWRALGLGVGVTALSALLDRDADQWAQENGRKTFFENLADVGNALPYVALGGAVAGALQDWDSRLGKTSVTALEAGLGSWALAEGLGYGFGRAEPTARQGPDSFQPFQSGAYRSLPSGHTTAVWATVTPYAREYDMPWLYGVAALTNFARVNDRDHWLSDTVAGSLLGYGIGSVLWYWHRDPRRDDAPTVGVTPKGVSVGWKFD